MSESANRKGFPYPLQMGSLEAFCHPDERSGLDRPYWHDGEAVAVNGFVVVRANRGLWTEADFEAMPAGVVERLGKLPWGSMKWAVADDLQWRPLADANLFRFGGIEPWLKGKVAPTRVVRVNEIHLVRLSFLQLVARLPRCEVYLGVTDTLLFRFSGGMGMLVKDPKLTEAGFSVFLPPRDCFDGGRVTRQKPLNWNFGTPPPPEPEIDGWPPVCAED
jgi:hypothetical protein